jgi:hypothetical protein
MIPKNPSQISTGYIQHQYWYSALHGLNQYAYMHGTIAGTPYICNASHARYACMPGVCVYTDILYTFVQFPQGGPYTVPHTFWFIFWFCFPEQRSLRPVLFLYFLFLFILTALTPSILELEGWDFAQELIFL